MSARVFLGEHICGRAGECKHVGHACALVSLCTCVGACMSLWGGVHTRVRPLAPASSSCVSEREAAVRVAGAVPAPGAPSKGGPL